MGLTLSLSPLGALPRGACLHGSVSCAWLQARIARIEMHACARILGVQDTVGAPGGHVLAWESLQAWEGFLRQRLALCPEMNKCVPGSGSRGSPTGGTAEPKAQELECLQGLQVVLG